MMERRKHLTETQQEFIMLYDLFMAKFLSGEIKNDENGKRFLNIVKDMESKLRESGEQKLKEEQEEKNTNERKMVNCPKCNKVVEAKVIGEALNQKKQRVNRLQCIRARHTFTDFLPIEEKDQLEWMDNLLEQLAKPRENGSYAEKFNIPQDEIEEMKQQRAKLAEIIEAEKAAKDEADKAMMEADRILQNVNDTLYATYGQLLGVKSGREMMN